MLFCLILVFLFLILMQELGLDAIDFYVARRQLRWLGHVSRMGWERLPRRMLSAWVAHKRPAGAPQFTYGRTIYCSEGDGRLRPRSCALDRARRGPRRVARDAPQRRGAGGLQAGAAAAGADADLALPCAAAARRRGPHQRCDRRVAEGGQRATLNSCLYDYSN